MYTRTFITTQTMPIPVSYTNYQTPSYYETMDLSDISEFKYLMTTSSDEDIPALEDSMY